VRVFRVGRERTLFAKLGSRWLFWFRTKRWYVKGASKEKRRTKPKCIIVMLRLSQKSDGECFVNGLGYCKMTCQCTEHATALGRDRLNYRTIIQSLGLLTVGLQLTGCGPTQVWVPYCEVDREKIGFEEVSSLGLSASDFLGLSLEDIQELEMLSAHSDVTWADGTQTSMLWGFSVDETQPVYWNHRYPAEPPEGVTSTALIAVQCTDSIGVPGDLLVQTDDGRLAEETFYGIEIQIQQSGTDENFVGEMNLELSTKDILGALDWDAFSGDEPYDSRQVFLQSFLDDSGGYSGTLSLQLLQETEEVSSMSLVDVGTWTPQMDEGS